MNVLTCTHTHTHVHTHTYTNTCTHVYTVLQGKGSCIGAPSGASACLLNHYTPHQTVAAAAAVAQAERRICHTTSSVPVTQCSSAGSVLQMSMKGWPAGGGCCACVCVLVCVLGAVCVCLSVCCSSAGLVLQVSRREGWGKILTRNFGAVMLANW